MYLIYLQTMKNISINLKRKKACKITSVKFYKTQSVYFLLQCTVRRRNFARFSILCLSKFLLSAFLLKTNYLIVNILNFFDNLCSDSYEILWIVCQLYLYFWVHLYVGVLLKSFCAGAHIISFDIKVSWTGRLVICDTSFTASAIMFISFTLNSTVLYV